MSHTEGFVSGWVPSYGDDDDVDINDSPYPFPVPDDLLSSPILSRTSSNDSHSQHLPSFDHGPPSPDSDGSAPSPLTSSDRRAIRNRQRDPDWVPRPRNAFIIFRCEYSRKNARDSNDTSDRSNRSDKTLSKRAADEWRCLSAAEREQYKILAEQEKAAHALQNPDYRFKPVRRTPPGVAARSRSSTCRRTDRSAQVASLIMRSERVASSLPRDDDVHEHKVNHPESATVPTPSTTFVAGRRRSASMPQPVAAQAVVVPAKARTPVPISCMSSPGPTVVDFDRFSSSEMDDSPLYTPVLPTSPTLHGLPSGFQMLTLPECPSPLNETFECGMGVGGPQVRFTPRHSSFHLLYLLLPSEFLGARRCHIRGLCIHHQLEFRSIRAIHVCRRRCIPRFAGVHDTPIMRRLGVLFPHHRIVPGHCAGCGCGCGAAQIARYRSGPIFRSDAPSYTPRSPAHDHDVVVVVVGTSRNPRRPLGHWLRRICRCGVRRCCSRPYRKLCGGCRPGSGGGIRCGRLAGRP